MSQRLIQSATSTVDAGGNINFQFSPTPMGSVWTGSVSIPNSPSGSVWQARILGNPWGTWAGTAPFGPIQAWGGEQLSIVASNLPPGLALAAIWTGMSEDEVIDTPQPVPMPNSPVLSTVSAITKPPIVSNLGTINPTHNAVLPDDGLGGSTSTKVFNVSNYQSLDIHIQNFGSNANNRLAFIFQWYDAPNVNDLTPVSPVSINEGPYVVGAGKVLHFRTPVKSAYLQIGVNGKNFTGASYRIYVRGLAAPLSNPICAGVDSINYISSGIFGPTPGQLIIDTIGLTSSSGASIPTGGTTLQLQGYFGPAILWWNSPATGPFAASIQTVALDDSLHFVAQLAHIPGTTQNNSTDNSVMIYLPPGDNTWNCFNSGAAAGVFSSLVPII